MKTYIFCHYIWVCISIHIYIFTSTRTFLLLCARTFTLELLKLWKVLGLTIKRLFRFWKIYLATSISISNSMFECLCGWEEYDSQMFYKMLRKSKKCCSHLLSSLSVLVLGSSIWILLSQFFIFICISLFMPLSFSLTINVL